MDPDFRGAMKGTIMNYRQSVHRQTTNQMIVAPEGVSDREKAASLVGKKVVWKSPAGKELTGEVRAAHGSKGAVRVLFSTGMPGQSLAGTVEIQ